jgi:hypothetical protein
MSRTVTAKPSGPARAARKHAPHKVHATPEHPRSVPIPAAEPDDERAPDQPFVEGVGDMIDPNLRHRMISEAAYMLYARRGYEAGYDLDDWLQAEAEVDHLLLNPSRVSESPDTA